jgi:hypothetical protein
MTYFASADIPAWPKEQPTNVLDFSPSLAISRNEDGTRYPLILIDWWIHDLAREDRWMVRLFPPESRGLRHSWSDPGIGRDAPKFRQPLRDWKRLASGETDREPRDSCGDAVARALELLAGMTDRETVKPVAQALSYLQGPVEGAARSFTTKFRPPKPRLRPSRI